MSDALVTITAELGVHAVEISAVHQVFLQRFFCLYSVMNLCICKCKLFLEHAGSSLQPNRYRPLTCVQMY